MDKLRLLMLFVLFFSIFLSGQRVCAQNGEPLVMSAETAEVVESVAREWDELYSFSAVARRDHSYCKQDQYCLEQVNDISGAACLADGKCVATRSSEEKHLSLARVYRMLISKKCKIVRDETPMDVLMCRLLQDPQRETLIELAQQLSKVQEDSNESLRGVIRYVATASGYWQRDVQACKNAVLATVGDTEWSWRFISIIEGCNILFAGMSLDEAEYDLTTYAQAVEKSDMSLCETIIDNDVRSLCAQGTPFSL